MITKQERYCFRKKRVRGKLFAGGILRPRLAVYRSLKYLYAQIIDDTKGTTLSSVSTLDKDIKDKIKSGKSIESAKVLGEFMAKKALATGIKEVCFDRAGRIYHGRIKAFADAARQAGLKF